MELLGAAHDYRSQAVLAGGRDCESAVGCAGAESAASEGVEAEADDEEEDKSFCGVYDGRAVSRFLSVSACFEWMSAEI